MKNRLITLVLTVAVLLSNSNSVIYAETNVNSNTETTSTTPYTDMKTGYHGEVEIPATPLVEKEDEIKNHKAGSTDDIPTSYKTENLPSIRDQYPYNTCWAFSATALAEISLIKREKLSLDFSELQIANFTNRTVEDPLGGTRGDKNYLCEDDIFDVGGNQIYAMMSYAAWVGATTEEKVPYSWAETVQQNGLDAKYAYDDVAHMKNAYIINLYADREAAKKVIMENGALGIGYYDNEGKIHEPSNYNGTYNSYYCPTPETSNHSVTVVGWDNNFSKENFNSTPEGDGAWLIRNSWGGVNGNENNHYGYFWISYYDKSLDEAAFAFEFVSDKGTTEDEFYDNNYQYDGGNGYGWKNCSKAANVFKAQKGQETLEAICFGTGNTCEDYTVKIYKNLTDRSNPESGTLVSTTTGKTTFEGIYTVKLSQPVQLKYADTFSVVVELTGDEGVSFLTEAPLSGWYNCETMAEKEQSFFYENGWYDYGQNRNRNIRIKAFTDNVINEIIKLDENEIEVSTNSEEIVFTKEESSKDLSATVIDKSTGEDIHYSTIYELSDDAIAAGYRVQNNSNGTYTISVDTTKPIPETDYILSIYAVDYDGVKTSKYKEIKLKTQKINIDGYQMALVNSGNAYTGNGITPDVSVWNQQNTLTKNTDYEVSYSNNINVGTATATVTGKGWYTGTLAKTFTITKATKTITVPSTTYSKEVGDTAFSLGAGIAAGESLSYASSNPAVATVDENGTVTIAGAGTATITISSPASANYNAAPNVTVTINVAAAQSKVAKTIKVSKKSYTKAYGSKAFSLGTKTAAGEKLKYATSDKKVVTVSAAGKVTVKGIGTATITITSPESANYKAATPVKVTITVTPKSVKLSTVKNVKTKAIKVTWKKDTSVTGYEILYSQKSNFKGAKKVTVTKNKTVSTTIKKLTKGKTYYVKVRAYKTVKGKKIYGAYSSVKKVKVTK